jgi:hypothetical protein
MSWKTWSRGRALVALGVSGWVSLIVAGSIEGCSADGSLKAGDVVASATGAGTTSTGMGSGGASASSSASGMTSANGGAGGATSSASGAGGGCNCNAPQVCDPQTMQCVDCLPNGNQCMQGQYCEPVTQTCQPGCDNDMACAPNKCDMMSHLCVECVTSADCGPGNFCSNNKCTKGCQTSMDCAATEQCCSGQCANIQTDLGNCGKCGSPCVVPANSKMLCSAGSCQYLGCNNGFADCNLDLKDGCEKDLAQGPCSCTPNQTKACYNGPPNTLNVGACKAGTSTCNAKGDAWGPCVGEKLPIPEICGNAINDDCVGGTDDPPDADGDGWNYCQGDCCDTAVDCTQPKLVNPGAFEFGGNMVDDDCDTKIDNVVPPCDANLASNSGTATDYAKAIDLCQTTTDMPALPLKKWGLISASLSLADGKGTPNASSRSIRTGFGPNVKPLTGSALAAMATGVAAAQTSPNNTNPAYVAFQMGSQMGTKSAAPADWLAANKDAFPNAPGCPTAASNQANDPVMLRVQVRVPTNAFSFNVSTFMYSAEYPEWVCSPYNDMFLALLDSKFVPQMGQIANPADKNLAVYKSPKNTLYPLGVNLAFGNTGLFQQCENGKTGCNMACVPGTTNACMATTLLTGTGFDILDPPPTKGPINGSCGNNNMTGGGTGWLTTAGNVVPGETIELRFVIWDTSDDVWDSLVLLDNFKWLVNVSDPGVHGG